MFGRLILIATLATAATSCGAESDRVRVQLVMDASGLGGDAPIPNDFGWEVTLEDARIGLASVQFFEGEPLVVRVWRAISPIGVAYAHPGHYVPGEALADMLERATLDLLSAQATPLAAGNGVSGDYNSATITLFGSPELDGNAARISGRARNGEGVEVAFSADIAPPDPITGIAFGETFERSPVEIRLGVDLSVWLKRVDFARIAGASEPVELEPGSQGHNALSRGLTNTSTWVFTRN